MRYWTAAKIAKIVPYKYDQEIRKIGLYLDQNDASKLREYFESSEDAELDNKLNKNNPKDKKSS